MKKVLWLSSWYPNRSEPLAGDFIERHAMAAATLNRVHVLFVTKDNSGPPGLKLEMRKYGNGSGATIRYYKPWLPSGKLESFLSGIRYFFIFRSLLAQHIRREGRPDLVHVHICFRAGLLGLYCHYRYGIKYIVSEHWSIFSPDARDAFEKKTFLLRWTVGKIYRHAAGSTAVSAQLSAALVRKFDIDPPVVLPNVVDSSKFFPGQHSHSLFRFIHISTLSYQKNPEQIVDALAMLKERTTIPFELVIYGPPRKDIQKYAEQKGLSALIDFRGEVNHDEIALQIRHSAALILFSRFETFGCVVAEALVSGVPVIVSDIAVMKELVTDFKNGILVPADRPDTLAGKMRWMIVNRYRFSSEIISAEAGRKYGISRIAGLFDSFYNKVTRSIT